MECQCDCLLSEFASYLNQSCIVHPSDMLLVGAGYFIALVFLVYQLYRSFKKARLISKPNPNVPWVETFCIHTLNIVRIVQIMLVAAILECVFNLVFILHGSKYAETFLWFWTTEDCQGMRTLFSWNVTNIIYGFDKFIEELLYLSWIVLTVVQSLEWMSMLNIIRA